MDLATITKTVEEIGTLAKAGNVEIKGQLEKLTKHVTDTDARILDLEQINAKGKKGEFIGKPSFQLGATLANDPKIELLRKGEISSAKITARGDLATMCKAVLVTTGTSGTSPEYGFPTPTDFIAPTPANAPGRALQVLQALPRQTVNAGAVVSPQLTTSTDGAGVQEFQAGAKGESSFMVHGEVLPMATVATYVSASRQLLSDVAALPVFLQNWLTYFVLRKYENLIVSGSGSESDGRITGLLNAGTAFTSGQTKNADKIADAAFTALPSFGYVADLILLSSADYLGIITERATTGEYVGNGWGAANPGTLWGIKAIPTAALAAGHAIVCSTQLISVLDREEINFAIGQTGSDFTDNVFKYLAELRGQLSVGDPHAVQVVALA